MCESFRHLIDVAQVPTLVLGGARSDYERDALELYMEAAGSGRLRLPDGRNRHQIRPHPAPRRIRQLPTGIAHRGWTVDDALRGETWDFLKLKARPNLCTGRDLCRGLRRRP